ncbi:Uncharacterised protein [Salmonella enterica subsp. enterica serovar Bovismorbificans]|nr:Uncharacterised protein [Salmonella enterica subsp. enterica serovar Bovismorbificans]
MFYHRGDLCALFHQRRILLGYAVQLVHGASQAGKPICLFLRRLADPCDKQGDILHLGYNVIHGTACGVNLLGA